jgi:hypothetical protein
MKHTALNLKSPTLFLGLTLFNPLKPNQNQPAKKVPEGGVLRMRKTSSLARLPFKAEEREREREREKRKWVVV